MTEEVKYLTLEEVADELRVSTDLVTRWIKSGELTGYRLARNVYRISRNDLDTFLATRKMKPPQES